MAEPTGTGLRAAAVPLAVTLAVQVLVSLAVYCAPVLAPVAGPALGVSPSAVGYFIAIVYLGSMTGSALAGGWVARWGPIRASQVGLCVAAAGLALGASGQLGFVILAAFVIGLGYGPATPASSHILVRAAPPGLFSLTFSIKQTGVPGGAVLAGAALPAFILVFGWQAGALAIALACVLLAVAIQPVRETWDRERDPRAPVSLATAFASVGFVLRHRGLAELAITSLVFGGVQITLVTYLVTFLTETVGLTLILAGMILAASQVSSVASRVLWGIVADRLLSRRTLLGLLGLGMGVSAIATWDAGPAWPLSLLFIWAIVFGATAVGWNGVFLAEVARIAPAGTIGAATGGCLVFTFLGVMIAPPLFKLLLALSGSYTFAYAMFGLPALLVGGRLLWRR